MDKGKLLVLGASGMLGNAVFRTLFESAGTDAFGTVRTEKSLHFFNQDEQRNLLPNVDVTNHDSLVQLISEIRPDTIVNCVGIIKQLAKSEDPLSVLPLNALFPHRLARLAALSKARVIHISTDCVFSGKSGNYKEECVADAADLYGRSKLLGELTNYENAVTLRTSIIGRELDSSNSLLDWFLSSRGTVKGYANAIFSGLPTCELARIIRDVVIPAPRLKGLYHVSAAPISKYELLNLIAFEYQKDINIIKDHEVTIDRSLDSDRFSAATGYSAPDWPELVRRMHEFDRGAD